MALPGQEALLRSGQVDVVESKVAQGMVESDPLGVDSTGLGVGGLVGQLAAWALGLADPSVLWWLRQSHPRTLGGLDLVCHLAQKWPPGLGCSPDLE